MFLCQQKINNELVEKNFIFFYFQRIDYLWKVFLALLIWQNWSFNWNPNDKENLFNTVQHENFKNKNVIFNQSSSSFWFNLIYNWKVASSVKKSSTRFFNQTDNFISNVENGKGVCDPDAGAHIYWVLHQQASPLPHQFADKKLFLP